jgi:hypothetical protein
LVGRAATTTSVGFEVARADPSGLDATTWERMRNPASACLRTYVLSAALEMRRQSDASGAPGPVQRNQRNANRIGSVPVQVPRVVRRTCPTCVVPDTAGSPVLLGATVGAADDVCVAQAAKKPAATATADATPMIAM